MRAIGCYIFAGGFTLGVKRAGFRVLAQLEDGPYGGATTRANHPDIELHADPASWPVDRLVLDGDGVDFIYGNPPCAPFSNAGISSKKIGVMGTHWQRDPRTNCIVRQFGVLQRAYELGRPVKVWAWESVQPALRRGRAFVEALTVEAAKMGYQANLVLMNAADLGVSQVRRRFFCVFTRVEIDWNALYAVRAKRDYATVRDAWQPLLTGRVVDRSSPPPKVGGELPTLEVTRPGENLRHVWERHHPESTWERNARGHVVGRVGFIYSRLHLDRPAPTLTGGATKYHPVENRFISLLEQQLICGYPPEYVFEGPSLSDKYAQTAQTVMPPVGEWLARTVRRAIEDGRPADPARPTIVDLEHGGRRTPFELQEQRAHFTDMVWRNDEPRS